MRKINIESNLNKKGSENSFAVMGKVSINDYTFNIDEAFESGWTRNKMNINIKLSEKDNVYAEMDGGYFDKKVNNVDSFCFANGIKLSDDGKEMTDYQNKIKVDFEDRKNESILADISDDSFIKIDIEKDNKGNFITKRFLSGYDAVLYLKDKLKNEDEVIIKGDLVYNSYGVSKVVKYLGLREVKHPVAIFNQTVLFDKDSCDFKFDDELGGVALNGYVVDYVGKPKINGEKFEVKTNFAFPQEYVICAKTIEPNMDDEQVKKAKEDNEKFAKALFNVDKEGGLYKTTVKGIITRQVTGLETVEDDELPDDLKEFADIMEYMDDSTAESLKKSCVGGGTKKRETFIIRQPKVKKVKNVIQDMVDKDSFKEGDLIFYSAVENKAKELQEGIDGSEEELDTIIEDVEQEEVGMEEFNIDELDLDIDNL